MPLSKADVLPEDALVSYNGLLQPPIGVSQLFQNDSSLKKLIKTLNPTRCRVVAPASKEHRETIPAHTPLAPLQSFANAETAMRYHHGWSVCQGYCILEMSSPTRFIALRHAWNSLPTGAWVDLTPFAPAADDTPRLLIHAQLLGIPGGSCSNDENGFEARLRSMLEGMRIAASEATPSLAALKLADSPPPAAAAPEPTVPKPPTVQPSARSKPTCVEDALAGVNAEDAAGHVRAGPVLGPLKKPSVDESVALEAFKACAAKMAELERQQQSTLQLATQGLQKVCGVTASVAHMGVVDGRMLVAMDGAVPARLMDAARDALQERAAFRRVEQSSPNAEQLHCVTDHDASSFCVTELYGRISQLVRLFFPGRAYSPHRIYTNAMSFGDVAHIHRDGNHESVTALLYPNEKWQPSFSGETMFFSEDESARHAVLPRPGRLLLFVGSIKHCGRPPSRLFWGQRFTLAIKFAATNEVKPANREQDRLHNLGGLGSRVS